MSEIITKSSQQVSKLFQSLETILEQLELLTAEYKPSLGGEVYLTDKELAQRLKVSRRTLQEWRGNGMIEYIQLDGKIIYAESAVQKLLDRYRRREWKTDL